MKTSHRNAADLLGVSATAARLGRSEGWVRRAADAGQIECVRTQDGKRYFQPDTVAAASKRYGRQA